MADLVRTVSFRVDLGTYQLLRQIATEENRKLGDVVRILLEQRLYGKVQPDHHTT